LFIGLISIIGMIMIFTCLLNSPPLEGGVASVSRKETGDEVVLIFKIFHPSVFDFFWRNQIHLPLKKGKELFIGLISIIGMIMIFACLLNSPPLEGGVASVSQKETGDEVVLIFKIFHPSVFDFFW
jgi:hypothetical protein